MLTLFLAAVIFVATGEAAVKLACERQAPLNIKCPYGYIEINDAYYGRAAGDRRTCGPAYTPGNYVRIPISVVSCRSDQSIKIISEMCQGKKECKVSASNSIFGDPCVGTWKYIKVVYDCKSKMSEVVPVKARSGAVVQSDNKALSISCPAHKTLTIIKAYYGNIAKRCLSSVANGKISNACNGQARCNIHVNKAALGDPKCAYGIASGLLLKYLCDGTTKQEMSGYAPVSSEPICLFATGTRPAQIRFPFSSGGYSILVSNVLGGVTCRVPNNKLWQYGCQPRNPISLVMSKRSGARKDGPGIVCNGDFNIVNGKVECNNMKVDGTKINSIATQERIRFYHNHFYYLWFEEDYTKETISDNAGFACYMMWAKK